MLSEENKKWIDENWQKLSIKELVQKISGKEDMDGRTELGRQIKIYIAEKFGGTPKTTKFEKQPEIELSEENKESIRALLAKGEKPLEIARIVFNNDKIHPLTREFKVIYKYAGEVDPRLMKDEDLAADDRYKSPTSINALITRVNKSIPNSKNTDLPLIDKNNIKPEQEKFLRSLYNYMRIPRFEYEINQYDLVIDRVIFESTFIRYTYDKLDLTQEQADQFISLSKEIVDTSRIGRQVQIYEDEIKLQYETDKRLPMSLVEFLNSLREKYDKSKERQKKLYDNLVQSRSSIEKKRIEENASVLNLIDAWKQEESRNEMLALAQKEKELEAIEVEKISSLDRLLIMVAGISKENGRQ